MHIANVIQQLGYPPSEVKLYLAALDIGESTITDLSLKVGMPRTSVQTIIEDMHRRGLMNYYLKRRRRYWVAENPEKRS
jgi:sugar-specific transcriptional regulator TrmB